ncbi:MAG TPA: glycosyltransferase [Acidobacteriaceae bacterium]|nr:glycosyltransferase [Acidobacteriaceae bacterium]
MTLNSTTDPSPAQTYTVSVPCCVVIPCYNEADRLPTAEYEHYLRLVRNKEIRLLFVNDGSRDRTLDVLTSLRDRYMDQVDVLDLQPNRGKAEAVRQGMLKVIASDRAAVTGFWDADLATPLAQIQDMLTLLASNPRLDLVFGSRVKLLGRDIQRKAVRHYLGRCFATVVSQLLHLPIYDSQCGAKLFRVTPDFSKVLAQPFQSRWIFDVEILTRFLEIHSGDAEQMKERTYEYPLPKWTDVAGSKVHPLDFLRSFSEMAEIYRQYQNNLRRLSSPAARSAANHGEAAGSSAEGA